MLAAVSCATDVVEHIVSSLEGSVVPLLQIFIFSEQRFCLIFGDGREGCVLKSQPCVGRILARMDADLVLRS